MSGVAEVWNKEGNKIFHDGEWVDAGKMDDGGTFRSLTTKEKKQHALKEAERDEWEKKTYVDDNGYFRVDEYYEKLGLLLHNPLTGEKRFCPFDSVTYNDECHGISVVSEMKEITEDEAMERAREYLLVRSNFIYIG